MERNYELLTNLATRDLKVGDWVSHYGFVEEMKPLWLGWIDGYEQRQKEPIWFRHSNPRQRLSPSGNWYWGPGTYIFDGVHILPEVWRPDLRPIDLPERPVVIAGLLTAGSD